MILAKPFQSGVFMSFFFHFWKYICIFMYLLSYILFISFSWTPFNQIMKLLDLSALSLHFVFIFLYLYALLLHSDSFLHLNFLLISHSSAKGILLCRPSFEFLNLIFDIYDHLIDYFTFIHKCVYIYIHSQALYFFIYFWGN